MNADNHQIVVFVNGDDGSSTLSFFGGYHMYYLCLFPSNSNNFVSLDETILPDMIAFLVNSFLVARIGIAKNGQLHFPAHVVNIVIQPNKFSLLYFLFQFKNAVIVAC